MKKETKTAAEVTTSPEDELNQPVEKSAFDAYLLIPRGASRAAGQDAKPFQAIYVPWTKMIYAELDGHHLKFSPDDVTDKLLNKIEEATGCYLTGDVYERLKRECNRASFVDLTSDTNVQFMNEYAHRVVTGHLLSSAAGVTIVMGKADAGKSHLMRHMFCTDKKAGKPVNWISAAEPYESILYEQGIMKMGDQVCSGTEDMVDRLFHQIFRNTECGTAIYLDSLRRLLYEISGGAAGEGGMNNMLVLQLTELSNIMLARGVTLIASLNPMMSDEKQDAMYERMVSSVAGAVLVEDKRKGKIHLREGRKDKQLNEAYDEVVNSVSMPSSAAAEAESQETIALDMTTSGYKAAATLPLYAGSHARLNRKASYTITLDQK